MVSYRDADPKEYAEDFEMMRAESSAYLERTLELMHSSWEEYARLFRTVGRVMTILQDEQPAGFYWIEEREKILHLHALILKPEFQGRGIGSQVLNTLRETYCPAFDAIELGVHASNQRALALYHRLGYVEAKYLEELEFHVLRLGLK
jgi:ribosomal protein S18 acetylase RimI-like enzyme